MAHRSLRSGWPRGTHGSVLHIAWYVYWRRRPGGHPQFCSRALERPPRSQPAGWRAHELCHGEAVPVRQWSGPVVYLGRAPSQPPSGRLSGLGEHYGQWYLCAVVCVRDVLLRRGRQPRRAGDIFGGALGATVHEGNGSTRVDRVLLGQGVRGGLPPGGRVWGQIRDLGHVGRPFLVRAPCRHPRLASRTRKYRFTELFRSGVHPPLRQGRPRRYVPVDVGGVVSRRPAQRSGRPARFLLGLWGLHRCPTRHFAQRAGFYVVELVGAHCHRRARELGSGRLSCMYPPH